MSFKDSIDDINNVSVTELAGVTGNPSTAMNVQANSDGTFGLAAASDDSSGGGGSSPVPTADYLTVDITNSTTKLLIPAPSSGTERWKVIMGLGDSAADAGYMQPQFGSSGGQTAATVVGNIMSGEMRGWTGFPRQAAAFTQTDANISKFFGIYRSGITYPGFLYEPFNNSNTSWSTLQYYVSK